MAKIPKPYFAASYAGYKTKNGKQIKKVWRFVGMEVLDQAFVPYVIQHGFNVMPELVRQLACLLKFLQDTMAFMHGDMHGLNVMVRGTGQSARMYLIDFGMSSYNEGGKRHSVDTRYSHFTQENPYVDFLMFLSHCQETFARKGQKESSLWCANIVMPFWNSLRRELKSPGDVQFTTMFGDPQHIVRSAQNRNLKKLAYAHHILYERAQHLRYTTSPVDMIIYIDTNTYGKKPPKSVEGWTGIETGITHSW